MRPSALVFEYDDFPPVPKDLWQGSELKQAVILAAVLRDHLRSQAAFSPEEPVGEDFGAILGVAGPGGITEILISFYPRDNNDFTWALQFSQRKPFLRGLFWKTDDKSIVGPVKEAIASLVASQPNRYRNPEWLDAGGLR
jgi:hypothetical protein